MKKVYIWIGILALAAALRLYRLGEVPMGVTNDELGYIWNAYALAHTGRNVMNEFLPVFTYFGQGFPFMPVPTYLQSLLFLVFELSAFSGRLLNVLLGIGSVYLIGLITEKITNKRNLAYLVSLALAISPWHIFFSRTSYDTVVASFFYLFYVLSGIVWIQQKRFSLWPFLWLFLALFSYRGMVPVSIGCSILLGWYGVFMIKRNFLVMRGLIVGSAIIIAVFFVVAQMQSSRGFMNEGTWISQVGQNIEYEMRDSQGPHTIKRIFLNKPMAFFTRIAEQYIGGYDFGMLFFHGEASQTYSMWMRGKWYAVDIFFSLLGLLYVFHTPSLFRFGIFSVGLLLTAGLPGLVGGAPYGSRDFFLTVPGAMLVGSGWYAFIRSKRWRILLVSILVILYVYCLSRFLFDYFFRYADQRREVWFESMKPVSQIIKKQVSENMPIVWGNALFFDFLQFAFYEQLDPRDVQNVWNMRTETPGWQQLKWKSLITDTKCSPEYLLSLKIQKEPLYIVRDGCWKSIQSKGSITDFYGNSVWHILTVEEMEAAQSRK